mgnify:CR=1 FL=1
MAATVVMDDGSTYSVPFALQVDPAVRAASEEGPTE